MKLSNLLFVTATGVVAAFALPALAQDPHDHGSSNQSSQVTAPADCPMMAHGPNGSGEGQKSQGMMGGQTMTQMMQQMQQMHAEMQQMHKEMMQMHQEMRHRR